MSSTVGLGDHLEEIHAVNGHQVLERFHFSAAMVYKYYINTIYCVTAEESCMGSEDGSYHHVSSERSTWPSLLRSPKMRKS